MRVFRITLLSLLLAGSSMAADVGKIAGTVIDEYGDGILGAAVQIVETSQGKGVMNLDGSYVILGVEPGTYTVRISGEAYGTQVYTSVIVEAGMTTTLDVVLNKEALQEHEITVKYVRPTVRVSYTPKSHRRSHQKHWYPERVNTIGVPAGILAKYDFPTRVRYR